VETISKTITEKGSIDEILSPVNFHGPLISLSGKTFEELTEVLNEFKNPYSLKGLTFGNGRFYALLELDRKTKIKKK